MTSMPSARAFDRARNRLAAPAMGRAEWGLLAALALIWGVAFLFIKVAVASFDPLTYVWLRLMIAAAALLAMLRLNGRRLALPLALWASIGLLALLNNVIPFLLFGWGQRHIASGLAAILQATTPIFGVIAAHLLTADEKITAAKLGGVLVGFAGVAVMIGPQLVGDGGNSLIAQLACLVGALLYALAGIYARRFKALGVGPLDLAAAQFVAGAVMLAPLALAFGTPLAAAPPTAEAWGALLVLALVCSAFAYVLYFRLVERAGATNSLLVTLLVPPIAIVVGAAVLGETFGAAQLGGLTLIAVGLAAIDGRLLSRLRKAIS